MTSEVLHWVSVKFGFKFSASEFEAATRAGANLIAQRQAAEAMALDRAYESQAHDAAEAFQLLQARAEEFGVWERAAELGRTTRRSAFYWAHELTEQAKFGGAPMFGGLEIQAEAIAQSRLRGDPSLVLPWTWPLGEERPAPTLEQVEAKLARCIEQSKAAGYQKRRRRAERRAR